MSRNNKSRTKQKTNSTVVGNSELDRLQRAVAQNADDIKARLMLADHYLQNGTEEKIVETLLSLESRYPFDDETSRKVYNRLLAFGYANINRLVEAEEICERGLKDEPGALDFRYVLSYVHLRMREYDKVITRGNEYLRQYEKLEEDKSPRVEYSASTNYLSQLLNFLGSAYFERSQWQQAIDMFDRSRQLDPANHLPYINLVNVARHHGDLDSARSIIAEGLKKCRQVQELRLLSASLNERATVSACLMVKNEEELLPDCLESIRDWVDEIIVVDTGSTDRTVEIAESFGAKVFHQPWEGNFSKHRNYSVELATSDWVFIIDADERFVEDDLPSLRRLINQDDVNIISINVFNVYGKKEELTTFLPSVRFWRKKVGLRYEGIVHNLLKLGEEHLVLRTGIRIKHLGYGLNPEKMRAKFLRSKVLLEKQLEENPDNAFALFNYAQLLKGEGAGYLANNIPVIIESASRAVELTNPKNKADRHVHLMCLDQIAWANFNKRDFKTAMEYCDRALELKPDYLDPLLLKAHIYAQQEQWQDAREAYNRYLDIQANYDPGVETDCLILTHIDSRANAYYGLGLIAEMMSVRQEAKEYYLKTVELYPGYFEVNLRLADIFMAEGSLDEAEKYYRNQFDLTTRRVDSAVGLAAIALARQNTELAEQWYQKAIEVDSANAAVRIKYGRLLLDTNRDNEAESQFRAAIELSDNARTRLELAETYMKSGRLEQAVAYYESVLEKAGQNAALLNDLGNCYFKMKQFDRAEQYYEQALAKGTPLDVAYRNLGLAKARQNKSLEAIEALAKYLQLNGAEPQIRKIIGDLHLGCGQFSEALEHYEQYLGSCPQDAGALFNLSECYLNMGHSDSARLGFRRVLELDPECEPARKKLENLSQPVLSA
ncbi:MAG: tetratricopeptide repeat protein [Candidatus Zixiibacteriota bacterium]